MIGLRGFPSVIGGIESHCEQLYPRLLARNPAIEVYVLGRSGYMDLDAPRPPRLHVRSLWAPRSPGAEALVHTLIATLYAFATIRPHLIHFHGIGPGFFCVSCRIAKIPAVVTHHAWDYKRPKWGYVGKKFLKFAEGTITRCADVVVCVSATIQKTLVDQYEISMDRTVVIRNGGNIPETQWNSQDILEEYRLESGEYILGVGRIDATKGFHDLVSAFESARPAGKKLVIAGSALYENEYSKWVTSHQSDSILFVGYKSPDELKTLYANAALFVHPSYMEGYGLVVIEALSAGVPVILSDIPVHWEFGLPQAAYFTPGDVQSLAGMLAQDSYDQYLAPNLEEILRENNWDECAARHDRLFEELMASADLRAAGLVRGPPA